MKARVFVKHTNGSKQTITVELQNTEGIIDEIKNKVNEHLDNQSIEFNDFSVEEVKIR